LRTNRRADSWGKDRADASGVTLAVNRAEPIARIFVVGPHDGGKRGPHIGVKRAGSCCRAFCGSFPELVGVRKPRITSADSASQKKSGVGPIGAEPEKG